MGKLGRLGLEPARRYERERPGELIHIDVKKLRRIEGGAGQTLHAADSPATDATSRTDAEGDSPPRSEAGMPFTSLSMTRHAWPTSKFSPTRQADDRRRLPAPAALKHLTRVTGITVERVITDNGSPYRLGRLTLSPAARSGSATSARAPTGPRPTAKQNPSSAPCSPAGPTARSTPQAAERTAALDGWLYPLQPSPPTLSPTPPPPPPFSVTPSRAGGGRRGIVTCLVIHSISARG